MAELLPHLRKVETRDEPATERQLEAIRRIGFDPDGADLTLGQASALISAKIYGEGAMFIELKRIDNYPHERLVEASLAAFIVKDDTLRARAMAWNERRFASGNTGPPRPKRDEHMERVLVEVNRLFAILIPLD